MKVSRMNKCLICYKSLFKLVKDKGRTNIKLSEQYTVIFAVRNLLEISSDRCVTYLKKCGNPTSWVSFCSTCRIIVEEAELISSQLNQLRSKLKDLQSQAKSSIIKSYINVDSLGRKNSNPKITDQIRLEVAQSEGNAIAGTTAKVMKKEEDLPSQSTSLHNHDACNEATEPMNLLTLDEIKIEDVRDPSVVFPNCSSEDNDWLTDGDQNSSDSDYVPEESYGCNKSKKSNISGIKGKKEASGLPKKKDVEMMQTHNLRSHGDTTGQTGIDEGGSAYNEDDLGTVQQEIKKPFICNICKRRFLREDNFKMHMETPHGPEVFECKHCTVKFKEWRTMKKHGLQVHFEEFQRPKKPPYRRIYTCQDCGKKSKSKSNHEIHLRKHTGERPYMCELCSATFKTVVYLRYHQSSKHSSEMNLESYVCQECGKGYASKFNLLSHSKSQHLKTFSLSCPICNAGFLTKSKMDCHMLLHSEEKQQICPICKNKFRYKGHLKVHMRIHSGEKPFSCRTCGKSFSENSHRLRHENIHTDVKDWKYECNICHKKFPVRNYLYIHLKSHDKTRKSKSKVSKLNGERACETNKLTEGAAIINMEQGEDEPIKKLNPPSHEVNSEFGSIFLHENLK